MFTTKAQVQRTASVSAVLPKAPIDYINPFIGATTRNIKGGSLGKTFPGATTPFGMTQVSPNTITGGDNGSGYSYEYKTMEGFALTQMSGIGWYGDLGNFLVMPAVGALRTNPGTEGGRDGYRMPYDKKSETASAGYYAVTLEEGVSIRAELTATPHCGMMRFTFPSSKRSRVQIDLARRVGGTSVEQSVKVVDDSTIEGWMKCTPDGGGWGDGAGQPNYTVFFCARFNKPLTRYGVWSANIPDGWGRRREDVTSDRYQDSVQNAHITRMAKDAQGKHLGFFAEFPTVDNDPVILKTGISFVSVDGAQKNLEAEIPSWDFDAVHAQARALWADALNAIAVTGGSETDKYCFYTALYHAMIDPRIFGDVDGNYPGGDGQPHKADGFVKRSVFSGWDVFRSEMPLLTIIRPDVVSDLISSMTALADENGTGYYDRWEFLNAYSGCMVGNPAIVVIADAYVKGMRSFNIDKAYAACLKTAAQFGNGDRGYSPGSISETLEYAYSDWCMAQLAAASGHTDDVVRFLGRGEAFRNVWDSTHHWFRPRDKNGDWEPWPAGGRLTDGYGTVESNPYQQGWFVPHEVNGMVALMGGRRKATADLVSFFQNTPGPMLWNPYYNHANEPVHHVAYLFNRLGAPWLTQEWTRAICRRAYHNAVEGLVGNDDEGQMSAWYVLSAAGLYPLCPGSTRMEITSPVFSSVTIQVEGGKTFRVVARGNSAKNIFIQRARLNGKPYKLCYLDFSDVMAGGTLELTMGPQPAKQWGIATE
ncbi:putative alpha-1,2-mannosidase [Dinghuibacter silviterrae]|uniref:Putative alpha-1,2-mannosidase n=2 Tax=Dinghuibacter silviterrae TaxID=1539049 RepID=A0A4R8DGT5_9BACT|nr:putative alpha-1,2-mannosidase [Dinghuibacter silviterrae]